MILNELHLPGFANQCLAQLGIDSYEQCLDKKLFETYPYDIFYFFNERGFRDYEWTNNFMDCIWCVGDSFTVGLGQMFEHTWHQQLAVISNTPIINISLNGASNDWISRKVKYILDNTNPKAVCIQWSYLHRRENNNTTLLDEQRLMHSDPKDLDDVANICKNIQLVETNKKITPVVHSFIPHFSDNNYSTDITALNTFMNSDNVLYFKPIDPVDLARDGHHYGKDTALFYAEKYLEFINHAM